MPRLGEALRAIVADKEEALQVKGRPESVLMNPTRQKIFEHLCFYPASRLRPLARRLGLNATVVQFHLRRMIVHQYVAVKNVAGISVYYPSDLKPSDEEVASLAILADDTGRELLKRIVEKSGLTPAELAAETGYGTAAVRRLLLQMEAQGLVAIVVDGKHNRAFSGESLPKVEKRTRQLLRGMKSRMLRRLARDRTAPEIGLDAKRESIVILQVGGKRYRFKVPSDTLLPWLTLR